MKRIIILINNFDDVSHNQHLLRLINFLTKKKFLIFLVALKNSGKLKNDFLSTDNISRIDHKNFFYFLKKNNDCLILTKELRSEYFVFINRLFLGWSKYKHITIRPSFGFLNESPWKIFKNILFYFSLFLVDLNIAVGKTVEKRIKKIKKQNVICIPNSLDDIFFKKTNKMSKINDCGHTSFIYSGVLEKRKNLKYTIDLLSKIRANFIFTILGKGPEKKGLIKYAKSKKINQKIFFLGHVEEVQKHLEKANVFIFLTKMEGLSLSLLEAMACGLTCIVSDIPENREIICDMENGVLLPINNQLNAIKKIENILNNKEKMMEIGKKAKETIVNNYCDSKSFKIYQKLLS